MSINTHGPVHFKGVEITWIHSPRQRFNPFSKDEHTYMIDIKEASPDLAEDELALKYIDRSKNALASRRVSLGRFPELAGLAQAMLSGGWDAAERVADAINRAFGKAGVHHLPYNLREDYDQLANDVTYFVRNAKSLRMDFEDTPSGIKGKQVCGARVGDRLEHMKYFPY